jgi:hypothetical protein
MQSMSNMVGVPDLPGRATAGGHELKAPLPRDMAALIRQMEKKAGKIFLSD